MTGTADGEKAPDLEPTTITADQDDADRAFLEGIARDRGYEVRYDGPLRWLEWSGDTPPPSDPEVADKLGWFGPFEPFRFPELKPTFSDRSTVSLSVKGPTFLSFRPAMDVGKITTMGGRAAPHVRDLAGRVAVEEDGRASPEKLGWLIAYRDALTLDLRRYAARLEAFPYGNGAGPIGGALATLKVWLVEAAAARGGLWQPRGDPFPVPVAMMAYDRFKGGQPWDDERITSSQLNARLAAVGLPRALAVSAVIGIRHHTRIRDAITAPAHDIWPRLLAAETVLAAALAGTPLDEAWVEEAIRQQRSEEERRARDAADAAAHEETLRDLRETLLDPKKRRDHIIGELVPAVQADPKPGSYWQAVHDLFVEAWRASGLPEHERPYPDARALSKAMQEADRRERK